MTSPCLIFPLRRFQNLVSLTFLMGAGGISAQGATTVIRIEGPSGGPIAFAAREIQRYVYQRSGEVLPIVSGSGGGVGDAIVLALDGGGTAKVVPSQVSPDLQGYRLKTRAQEAGGRQLRISSRSGIGLLYGAYRLAEHLGVRFYLSEDVVPEGRVPFAIPDLDEVREPLFKTRGILPFHDFAEGPDWWNADDYETVIGQLPKLGMNFIGLHTYPEGGVGPEPTTWIGMRGEYDASGAVSTAYPVTYHTTGRSGRYWWSYAPRETSSFPGGANQLYERDDFGADVMADRGFEKQTPASSIEVFNLTGKLLHTAFTEAHRLGVATCVGTETPLALPEAVRTRALEAGADLSKPDWARPFYSAIFERMSRAYPVDYYWLWTPEGWTWEGNKAEHFTATENDIRSALGALADLKSPATLATSGWVLGPQHDRAALDKLLPANSPMSAINPAVGHGAIERQFANLSDRPRWAIPWLENDPALTIPQLWAGRMRFDAADALRLGCDGLIGIHWRTRILAPTVAALAAAAWDQPWVPADFDRSRIKPQSASGAIGGHTAPAQPKPGDTPAASNRVGMTAYHALVPKGTFVVKLGFSEVEGLKPGERVFTVKLQGREVLSHFDPAKAGAEGSVRVFNDVVIDDSQLRIDFVAERGEPSIASIEVEGVTSVGEAKYRRKINCGGETYGEFEPDFLAAEPRPSETRGMPVGEFYADFARANFGEAGAGEIAAIFTQIDGRALPEPCNWLFGPGDILRNPLPWSEVAAKYKFVEDLEKVRVLVKGAGNLDRFDYWLTQMQALRLVGELGCIAGALDKVMAEIGTADDEKARRIANAEALPLRMRLARGWENLLRLQIEGASTPGELGTLANLEQRSRSYQKFLSRHDEALAKGLGGRLPENAEPSMAYRGRSRIIVPTVRGAAALDEQVRVKVLLVGRGGEAEGFLHWRRLGEVDFQRIPLTHVARAVFAAMLPPMGEDCRSIEYFVEATIDGEKRRWPVSPQATQVVVAK